MGFEQPGAPSSEQRRTRTHEEFLQASKNLGAALKEDGKRSTNLIRGIVTELVKQNEFPESDIDRDVSRAETALRHAQAQNPNLEAEEIYALLAETVRHGLSEAAQAWDQAESAPISGERSAEKNIDQAA